MRIKYILVLSGLFLTGKLLSQNFNQVFDNKIFNEVISSIIEIDSLKLNYNISKSINKPIIYSVTHLNESNPPAPPPISSVSFEELFTAFESDNDSLQKYNDSTFIVLQTKLNSEKNFSFSIEILNKFDSSSSNFYNFYLPIFSYNKQYVYVQYWRICGKVCGDCHSIVLKKHGDKWIKINSQNCGVS